MPAIAQNYDTVDIEQLMLKSSQSGITPPKQSLGVYVVDSGRGLDTGCTYASGGPLDIELAIPQVLNDSVLVNGKIDPTKLAQLVNQKIISAKAQISMPVFDVDSSASVPGRQPEIDKVYFNGVEVGTLQGVDNRWTETRLEIPIEEIDFENKNIISIDIDVANTKDSWCMSVDWVAIEFDVALPIVLAHGINAQADTWDENSAPGVLTTLNELGIRYERYSLGKNDSTANNAQLLNNHIQDLLDELNADKVHIIAHSKGGLDTQNLQHLNPEFEIKTLSTFSTPHLGSVAADFSLIKMDHAADAYSNTGADPHGYARGYMSLPTIVGPQLPGIRDLSTQVSAQAVAQGARGNIATIYALAANADLNRDGQIEKDPDLVGLFPWGSRWAGVRTWNALRHYSSAAYVGLRTVSLPQSAGHVIRIVDYTATQISPQENDVVVTLASATPNFTETLGVVAANHSTMKTAANLQTILERIVALR